MYDHPDIRIRHTESAEFHFLHAEIDAEPNQVGVINWSKDHDGQLVDVWVDERYRRQGIATLLWETAEAGDYDPPIRMTPHRTDMGELWAATLGTGVKRQPWDGQLQTYWTDA